MAALAHEATFLDWPAYSHVGQVGTEKVALLVPLAHPSGWMQMGFRGNGRAFPLTFFSLPTGAHAPMIVLSFTHLLGVE